MPIFTSTVYFISAVLFCITNGKYEYNYKEDFFLEMGKDLNEADACPTIKT